MRSVLPLILPALAISVLVPARGDAAPKTAFTVSKVTFKPRKADGAELKDKFVVDVSATIKLTQKVDDPNAAWVGFSGFCYTGRALSNSSTPLSTMTPLTEMTVGKTQALKGVVFTRWGLDVQPDVCSLRVYQGEKDSIGGTPVAEFCWRKGVLKPGAVDKCT